MIRRSSIVFSSVGMALSAIACGGPNEGVELGVDETGLESPFSAGEQALDLQHRQDAVRRFFAERLARLDIVDTTVTDSGDVLDWVPFEPPIAEPPPSPPLEFVNGEEPATTELMDQPWARGPEGTVPHRRFDVEAYLQRVGDKVPDDPASALRNKPAPAADPTTHRYYASYQLSGTSTSTEYWTGTSYLNIWNAADVYSGETNIAQIAMDRGTGLGHQTVETGKVEFDDGAARFFTYFTTRNYDGLPDDWVQGYDDDVLGFHQQSSVIFPGTAFTAGQTSVLGGTQRTWAV